MHICVITRKSKNESKCKICGKSFKSIQAVRGHKRIHPKNKKKRVKKADDSHKVDGENKSIDHTKENEVLSSDDDDAIVVVDDSINVADGEFIQQVQP